MKGHALLADYFNARIARIVQAVTTPLVQPGEEKNKVYARHVKQLAKDPEAEIVKLGDTIENAVGNHSTKEPKRGKLDIKYLPIYPVHLNALYSPDSLIQGGIRENVVEKLFIGQQRAALRIARRAINDQDDVTLAV